MSEPGTTVIAAGRLFDGTARPVLERGVIVIRGDSIQAIGAQGQVDLPAGEEVVSLDFPNGTILPGLVDIHTHMMLAGDGNPAERMMQYDDGVLLLQAAANAQRALHAGVTSLADMGGRNRVTFSLRQAMQLGLCSGPRLVLSGRPLTRKGGHCWFFNGEAEGSSELHKAVEQLVEEGVDVIKVMATGGGTLGTDPYCTAYTTEELRDVTQAARAAGKKTAAHCNTTAGISRALDARFDMLFHCNFYEPNGQWRYDKDLARRLADSGTVVNPTLQVARSQSEALRAKRNSPSLEEQRLIEEKEARYIRKLEYMNKLVAEGVRMVAGSDAGWGLNPFGDLVSELEEMIKTGMSPTDVILASTRDAAQALGIDQLAGSLEKGKKADLLVVNGDPTHDIRVLRELQLVVSEGKIVNRN